VVALNGNPVCASPMARPRKKNRHLPPCVYLKHGAYWFVRGGKWTRLGDSLEDALAAYAGVAPLSGRGGSMPRLIDKVLAHVRPTVKPESYRQYVQAAKHAKRILAEFDPEDVQTKHIAAIKLDMASTPNMANRTLTVLRIVFRQAVEWQLISQNPCNVKPYEENKRDRYITDAEFQAIREQAPPRLQAIMDLLYLTGQRVTDVLGIRRSDLTGEGIQFKQQKTDARLLVEWSPDLIAAVERAKALQGKVQTMTLFAGRKGKPVDYRTTKDQWTQSCKAAGVESAQMRDLRAKSLTDARKQGLNATALAGHASEQMTDRYIRQRTYPAVTGPSFRQLSKTLSNSGK
jgi:integrase